MCSKIQYHSKRDANIAIKDIKRNSSRSHIPRRTYYCRTCNAYHLTSKTFGQKIVSKMKITARKIKNLKNKKK